MRLKKRNKSINQCGSVHAVQCWRHSVVLVQRQIATARGLQRHGDSDACKPFLHVVIVQLVAGSRVVKSQLLRAPVTQQIDNVKITVENMETHMRVIVFLAFVGKRH